MRPPGYVSVDGSPLSFYLALPPDESPLLVHRAIRPQSSILELGSGPGRMTRVLVALGHRVTAVDDSSEMLLHVTGAERVCDDVFDLDLGRTFDAVVAASHLVNRPGPENRRRLLDVGRRHLAADGVLLIERYVPGWLRDAGASTARIGPVEIEYTPRELNDGVRSATVTYRLEDHTWRQDFDAEDVTGSMLEHDARHCGLVVREPLDSSATWLALRPT